MKSDTALVRSDSRIELYSVTAVYLNLAVVVYPRNSEDDLTLRLNESFHNACIAKAGILIKNGLNCFETLSYCLKKLRFAGVSLFYLCINICKILICECHFKFLLPKIIAV